MQHLQVSEFYAEYNKINIPPAHRNNLIDLKRLQTCKENVTIDIYLALEQNKIDIYTVLSLI